MVRENKAHHAVSIPTLCFRDLLDTYGVPHYLKVDIEGNDYLCIADLAGSPLPTYLSTEAQRTVDGGLGALVDAGYRRFKLIRQTDWWAAREFTGTLCQRILASMAFGRLRGLHLGSLARPFTDRYRIESLGHEFQEMSSGPWGEDTPGPWLTSRRAPALLEAERLRVKRSGTPALQTWWDWHAKSTNP